MLAQVRQDEVGGDGRDLVQARLAELALHIVFRRESVPAVGLQARIGRLPRCVGRQQLRHVRLSTAGLSRVKEARCFVAHQVCRPHIGVRLRNWELDALVLSDRAIEDDALVRVRARLVDKPVAIADALRGDQNALGVHAIEYISEALALFPYQIFGGNLQVVKKDFVGLVIDHVADGADRQPLAHTLTDIDQEDR